MRQPSRINNQHKKADAPEEPVSSTLTPSVPEKQLRPVTPTVPTATGIRTKPSIADKTIA
ncbi:hypothetical protein DPMN_044710 [Dreissena polymorpha]|uniref:Uncharacterized protein n=1 Tax=Dreissena polymorpha TaxID=45954 RepID=A0A9D4D6B8_DREPO|nr:hypothetical protein DPMN_044710 [Dreissena polymorpha]